MKNLRLKPPEPKERDLQRQIVEGLRWKGYTVLEIGKTRAEVICFRCGARFRPSGWQGNTPGAPDLLVSRPEWQRGAWIGLELKTATGRVRPEQQALAEAGRVFIVRSWEEALRAVESQSVTK